MMELLLIVTCGDAAPLLAPLTAACGRRQIEWAAFFTHDGVIALDDPRVRVALQSGSQVIACQDSWNHHRPTQSCPVELGSQTSNSAMIAAAARIVSL